MSQNNQQIARDEALLNTPGMSPAAKQQLNSQINNLQNQDKSLQTSVDTLTRTAAGLEHSNANVNGLHPQGFNTAGVRVNTRIGNLPNTRTFNAAALQRRRFPVGANPSRPIAPGCRALRRSSRRLRTRTRSLSLCSRTLRGSMQKRGQTEFSREVGLCRELIICCGV